MKIIRNFLCNVLGWHKPNKAIHYLGEDNFSSDCKYCGKRIMRDSQGNWFEISKYAD